MDLLDKLVVFYGVRALRECGVVIDKLLDVVRCCGDSVVVFRCVLFVSTFLLVEWRRRGDLVGILSEHIQHTIQLIWQVFLEELSRLCPQGLVFAVQWFPECEFRRETSVVRT